MATPLPAVTGAWFPGDPVGDRRFVDIGTVDLESGRSIPDVRIAYESWGELSPTGDNAILVLHALTGDSHVVGPTGPGHPSPGWWQGLIGPGEVLDTNRWFVVAPNILGGCQGTTGPSSAHPDDGRPWGSRFPRLTTRDQVAAELAWADALGIERWALVVGGSAGGMRGLEWAVTQPARVERLFSLASTPYATGDQIAWCHAQIETIRADRGFSGGDYYDAAPGDGPHAGLAAARKLAHITYRSLQELNERFDRTAQPGEDPLVDGRFAVQGYLDHHGDKLVGRFDANSYVILTQAMNSHDVGRGRGGVSAALGQVTAETVVVAIDSDRLYPPELSHEMAAKIPAAGPVEMINSLYGHDGFLIEREAVAKALGPFLQ